MEYHYASEYLKKNKVRYKMSNNLKNKNHTQICTQVVKEKPQFTSRDEYERKASSEHQGQQVSRRASTAELHLSVAHCSPCPPSDHRSTFCRRPDTCPLHQSPLPVQQIRMISVYKLNNAIEQYKYFTFYTMSLSLSVYQLLQGHFVPSPLFPSLSFWCRLLPCNTACRRR